MKKAKAVILARGLGKRMRRADPAALKLADEAQRLASQGLKGMIPVRGRPFLDYVVDSLLAAGLNSLCLVVAPGCELLMDYVRRTGERTGAEMRWAVQQEPLGTADAVLAAEGFAGRDPFVMVNADNLYPADALGRLAAVSGGGCYVVAFDMEDLLRTSNFGAGRVRAFAAVAVTEDGRLADIVEKPPDPQRYETAGKLWVSMNLYRFTPEIFEACRRIEPDRQRGELELTAAVRLLARSGRVPFRVIFSGGPVLDLTGQADVASLEAMLEGRSPGS